MNILTFSLLTFLVAAAEANEGDDRSSDEILVDRLQAAYKVLAIIFAVLFGLQLFRAIAFLIRQKRIEEVFPFRRRFGCLVLASTLLFVVIYASYAIQDYNLDIARYILFPFPIALACTGLLLLLRCRRNAFYVEEEKTTGSNERTTWGRFVYTILPIVCMAVMVVAIIVSTTLYYTVTQWTLNLDNAEVALKSLFHIAYIFLVASLIFSSAKIWRCIKQQLSPTWEVYDLNVSALFPFTHSTIEKPRLRRLTGPPSHHSHNLFPPLHRRTSHTHLIHRLQSRPTVRALLSLAQIPTKPRHRLHYYPWTSLDCHSPSSHFARKTT